MGKLFGTDGIRGVANEALTPELAMSVGRAVVGVLREEGIARPQVLVGRDPRWSGEVLEAALIAGIASAGGDALTVGVIPTPGVAFLASRSDVAAGIMISASHNPVEDNGIKVFAHDGYKLSDDEEARLEELIATQAAQDTVVRPTGTDLGRILHDASRTSEYVEHLVDAADEDLSDLHVVVDGANGSASHIAPHVYRRLGAEVTALHCDPDGSNINAGAGSTHPEVVAQAVREQGAHVGLSHDGDADRLIAADEHGEEVDGDVILAVLARDRKDAGTLKGDTVVTTVMTNLGFKRAMREHDIEVVETKVGDRYVLEAMRERGAVLGGEQSGHLIQLDHATTGDGILTAVSLLCAVRRAGGSLQDLATIMSRLPQVLVNVRVRDKDRLGDTSAVWDAVEAEERRLGDDGRVLVRPSGTEPVVRVMVEATDEDAAAGSAERIAEVVREHLAG